jgi:TolB-like protein/Tfp pilus assembly protein PilF
MAVLVCLARHAGEVVTRDEFSDAVWGGRVVSDEALSRCISVLRQVFADQSREPRFIRTIARVGYTLVQTPRPLPASIETPVVPIAATASPAPVASPVAPVAPPVAPAAESASPSATSAARSRINAIRRRGTLIALAGIACLLVLAFLYFTHERRTSAELPIPPVRRLLVLPFDTREAKGFGHDVGIELADEISSSLARVEQLQISGRTSADAVAAENLDAVQAGRKLGVDAVLSGAVAERTGGLRVTVRLMATHDARELWSQVYERDAADIFAVQSSIASAVARELVGLLTQEGRPGVRSFEADSRDLEAYQLYLRGAHQVRLRGEDSLRRAVDLFSAALRRDPTYARAQVGLAWAYALLPSYSYEDPAEMYALAEKELGQADELSHSRTGTAGVRAYLGFVRAQWIESETAFRTAIAADPNNPEVRQMYSQLLGSVGRLDAALVQVRLAQEIDPLAPVVADRLGILYLWRGRDAEAANYAALARELGLDEVANPETKILLKLHQHEDAEAMDSLHTLQKSLRRPDDWVRPFIDAYRHPQQRPAAIALIENSRAAGGLSPRIFYGVMVLLESPVRALKAFEALPTRGGNDLEFLFSSDAAAVRRDPAFGDFVRKMGIEAYWDRFGWSTACHREVSRIVCH